MQEINREDIKIHEFDEKENIIKAILDYFKLVYIEKLTINKSISSFKILGGENLINDLLKNCDNKLISLEETNYVLIQKLKLNFEKLSSFSRDLSNLEWLMEILPSIDASDKVCDTITTLASFEVYNNYLNNPTIFSTSKEKIMQKRIKEIEELLKNKENN